MQNPKEIAQNPMQFPKTLKPFMKNKIKEQIKSPKTYISDLGIKNSLINNFNKPELRDDKGFIYENFVLSQLTRNGLFPKYFNINKKYEIDFVIEYNGNIYGIEVKSSTDESKVTRNISTFLKQFKPRKIYVLNNKTFKKTNIQNIPVIYNHYLYVFKIIDEIINT